MIAARRFGPLLALLLVFGPAANVRGQETMRDAESLLSAIGRQSAGGERRATFLEIKTSALLNAPLESRGTLTFRAPDLLEKTTTAPQHERVRIQGGTLTIEGVPVRGQTQRRAIALADVPLLVPLVESLRATLAGDLPALRRHYDLSLVRERQRAGAQATGIEARNETAKRIAQSLASASAWTLALAPRDPALRGAVDRVLMHGVGVDIGLVEIIEVSGDRTELWITPIR